MEKTFKSIAWKRHCWKLCVTDNRQSIAQIIIKLCPFFFFQEKTEMTWQTFLFLSLCHFKMEEFWILAVNQMAFTALSWHGAAKNLKRECLFHFHFHGNQSPTGENKVDQILNKNVEMVAALKLFSCIRVERAQCNFKNTQRCLCG